MHKPTHNPQMSKLLSKKHNKLERTKKLYSCNNVDPIVSNPLRWADMTESNRMNGKNIDKTYLT